MCFTETWLRTDSVVEEIQIPYYQLHLNSNGAGKGLAIYYNQESHFPDLDIKKDRVQMTRLRTQHVNIITVYRSQGADCSELMNDLQQIVSHTEPTIICGDFNLCLLTLIKVSISFI